MFSDFFNDFFEQKLNIFNRPVKDMSPYKAYRTQQGCILAVNTLGIAKENLNIELLKPKGYPSNYSKIKIKGETKIDSINFENTVDLEILLKFERKIEEVSYSCKDGITLVYLKLEPEHEEVIDEPLKPKFIEDGDQFNW